MFFSHSAFGFLCERDLDFLIYIDDARFGLFVCIDEARFGLFVYIDEASLRLFVFM